MTSQLPDPDAVPTPDPDAGPTPDPDAGPTPDPDAGPDGGAASAPDPDLAARPDPDIVPAPDPDAAPIVEAEPEEPSHEPEPDTVQLAPPAIPDDVRRKRLSGAGVLIGVLLALFGFTLVVQVRSNAADSAYASAREGDLIQIMSDLDAAERRLNQDIASLEQTRRELQSGAAGRDAALAEAKARADALGILSGTLKARGPGVLLRFYDEGGRIKASTLLNAVQELRGAGAEALQIDGGSGGSVRIIASTSFIDADAGVRVDGRQLTGPYTIRAIGDPSTMRTAMEIAGGVKAAANNDGGKVIVDQMELVEISETRSIPDLEYARPVR